MKTYLLHHTPKSAGQDGWAVSFSIPYIATSYARAGDGVWYVRTWLSAEQVATRLSILFDSRDELRIHELGRKEAGLSARMPWLDGRLDLDDDDMPVNAPRVMWDALQSAVATVFGASGTRSMAATARSSRAA